MEKTHTVYLLLGSNLGDCEANIHEAIGLIANSHSVIISKSSVYKTAPWGIADQPDFLNQAICVETTARPDELMASLQQIEQKIGKRMVRKWGERVIDIDILFYDDLIIDQAGLCIPHPRIQERNFTLVPLKEIAPKLLHPVLKKTIAEICEECNDILYVKKLTKHAI